MMANVTNNINSHPPTSIEQLSMLSYNPTGWSKPKIDLIKLILISHSIQICAIQEHFQLENNLYRLNSFENYEVFSVGATKKNNVVNRGRPSGGLSLIYHQNLGKYATPMTVPGSSRVQGLKLNFEQCPFLIINTYFPNDPRTVDFDDSVLVQTLEDIKYLVNLVDDSFTIVLMGDLNADMSRNTTFTNIVAEFCAEINVESIWNSYPCDFTYYHERVQNNRTIVSKSVIDHFCVSLSKIDSCVEAAPLHLKDNLSYHDPIFIKFDQPVVTSEFETGGPSIESKILWNRATPENINHFKSELSNNIHAIPVNEDALLCLNVHCTSESHKSAIDQMSTSVFDSISTAVENCIPSSKSADINRPHITGWNDSVKEWKDLSIFWKSVWISAGRPIDTDLHRTMKHYRNQYHYAIRRVKNQEKLLRKNKFLLSCLNNNINDIFTEIRNMRNNGNKSAKMIDGKTNSADIAGHFKSLYDDIYNTHNDKVELNQFSDENSLKINESQLKFVDKITPAAVKKYILKFHNGKNDSNFKWRSDAMKHGVDILCEPLSDLLKSMIIHGYIPSLFLLSYLIPIIKDNRASKMNSSNYRLIAISSLLLKIVDHIILDLFHDELAPAIYQFGFQRGKSTTLCTWAVSETVNYFRNRGSPVFLCLLDLTKAFDMVRLSDLFKKLSSKIPPLIIRFIMVMYIQQSCTVQWNGNMSSEFTISNGVRQGAVLSPCLFNLYIDDLYSKLINSGVGCKINNMFFGCFSYADDIALLAPSREALQIMINICEKFFREHGIKISTNPDVKKTKTKIIIFGIKSRVTPLSLNGNRLPTVDSWLHLGHLIHSDENSSHDLDQKRREIIGKIHSLQQELGPQDPAVFLQLVKTYVLHLYGCQLWDIFSNNTEKLWATWHRTIKIVYDLPHATHRYLLNDLVNFDHIKKLIIKRFLKFSEQIRNIDVPQITLLHRIQSCDYRSVYGRNILNILREAGSTQISDVKLDNITINPAPPGCEWRSHLLKDLLRDRFNSKCLLSLDELNQIIVDICVN